MEIKEILLTEEAIKITVRNYGKYFSGRLCEEQNADKELRSDNRMAYPLRNITLMLNSSMDYIPVCWYILGSVTHRDHSALKDWVADINSSSYKHVITMSI